jgi:hypothetical protein
MSIENSHRSHHQTGHYLHGKDKNGMELISFCTCLVVQPYFLMECIWRRFSCCRRYVQRSNSSERTKSPEKTKLCCTEITYAEDRKIEHNDLKVRLINLKRTTSNQIRCHSFLDGFANLKSKFE